MKRVYTVKNLGCANCAAKMERAIGALPEVEEVRLSFASRRLTVVSDTDMTERLQSICEGIEHGVVLCAEGKVQRTYSIKNLGCANCAAKMERAIGALPEVEEARLSFASRRLTVVSDTDITERLQSICEGIEHGAVLCAEGDMPEEEKTSFWAEWGTLIVALVLFAAGFIVGKDTTYGILLLAASYLTAGYEVLLAAGRNLVRGHVFDENFLMGVATLGALAIGEYEEAAAIMLFYLFGEGMQERAEAKSRRAIRDASLMRPETVVLIGEDGTETVALAEKAAVGDLLRVRVGDRIPLDGVVVGGESRLDTSPVTGESVPRRVQKGDEVLSGCMNLQGVLTLRAVKTLENSFAYRMMEAVTEAIDTKPRMDRFITRFARVYTPIVVGIALLTAALPPLFGGEWHYWIYTAITFLVISCPCALVLSVPLSFFSGIGSASRRGILFKSGLALETLASVKAVALDKTGTVTEGNFVCQKVILHGTRSEEDVFFLAGCAEMVSTHPIAKAIVRTAERRALSLSPAESAEEAAGEGLIASVGKTHILLGNRRLLERHGVSVCEAAAKGTVVFLAADGVHEATLVIDDTIKADAKDGMDVLRSMNLHVTMLTGDSALAARRVASAVGIKEVREMLLPSDKLAAVRAMRERQGRIAFVGDGLNDAPVLAGADVGMAFASGSDTATEAADVVLMRSEFGAVGEAVRTAVRTMRIARQNIVFALGVKLLVLVLGLVGMASMWLAVFADTGVALLCVLNAVRLLGTDRDEEKQTVCCAGQEA